ncbi:farnesoate epoxidase-like [Diaphorina citri]|uniref:Farnesoate epoxidase-like n=1 Tax=Diaphorina citri TaxID=121845 RepID=A0A3Q0IQA7_DIACI|nr:farnesoate epoxidase-like [Diaphorina citri]
MFFLIIGIAVLVFLFCKYFSQRPGNFPPGPPNHPLIGGLLSMPSGETHFTQQEWLTKYGGVVGIMMGPRPGLFIQGAPYVQDALKKPEFQGRPHTADFKERSFGKFLGIFFCDGPQWQNSRKFTVKFTKGVKDTEGIMQLEMDELFRRITNGQVYEMNQVFRESTVNILTNSPVAF